MPTITLFDLASASDVEKRLNAYMRLFAIPLSSRSSIRVTVRGIFEEEGGRLVSLEYVDGEIVTGLPFRRHLVVEVMQGKWVWVKPVGSFDLVLSPRE